MKLALLMLLVLSAFAQHTIVVQDIGTVKLGSDAVNVVQKQLTQDFYPAWGITASLRYTIIENDMRFGEIVVRIMDTEYVSWNYTGYVAIRLVDAYGKPIILIFMDKIKVSNIPPAYVLGHEIMEYLVNPKGTYQVLRSDTGLIRVYRLEICDAVQKHMYSINGMFVSNFTLPAFWGSFFVGPYDYMGKIMTPFGSLASDGELSYFTVAATI